MKSLKVALCEDDSMVANLLADYLDELGHHVVFRATGVHKFLEALENNDIDIALLDYNLGDLSPSGATLGRKLNEQGIPFIYVTAYSDDETIRDIVSTRPEGYIVKPFTKQQLMAQLELFISSRPDKTLEIKQGSNYVKLHLHDIKYIEAFKNYVKVFTITDEQVELRLPLSELTNRLPDTFTRIHRSFIVNTTHIIGLNGEKCTLKDGTQLRVSRTHREQLNQLLD